MTSHSAKIEVLSGPERRRRWSTTGEGQPLGLNLKDLIQYALKFCIKDDYKFADPNTRL
ncbi:hypothetical protein [Pararhizobium polonicum]|uniref:hypothetical protein n=1 Tax=Pararhizobium polonicum TaxID=1612624 RepID=UPI000A686990|nr:hypothetical protein [Pararhizobium polonicum]